MTLIKYLILLDKYQPFEYVLQTGTGSEKQGVHSLTQTHTHTHTHLYMKQKGKVIAAGRTGIYRG